MLTKVHLFSCNNIYVHLQVLISGSVWTIEARGLQVTCFPRVPPRKGVPFSLSLQIPETICGTGKIKAYDFDNSAPRYHVRSVHKSGVLVPSFWQNLTKHLSSWQKPVWNSKWHRNHPIIRHRLLESRILLAMFLINYIVVKYHLSGII